MTVLLWKTDLSRAERSLGEDDIVAREVSYPQSFRIRQNNITEIPLVCQMSVPDCNTHSEELSDWFRVNEEVFHALRGPGQILVVVLEAVVEPLGGGTPPCADKGKKNVNAGFRVSHRGRAETNVVLDLTPASNLFLE